MANARRHRHQRRRDLLIPLGGLVVTGAIAVVAIAVLLLVHP